MRTYPLLTSDGTFSRCGDGRRDMTVTAPPSRAAEYSSRWRPCRVWVFPLGAVAGAGGRNCVSLTEQPPPGQRGDCCCSQSSVRVGGEHVFVRVVHPQMQCLLIRIMES